MRGGYNSLGKTEAESVKKISTCFLYEHNYFVGWRSGTITWTSGWSDSKSSVGIEVVTGSGEEYLRIHYTQTDRDTDEKTDFDYKIPLLSTPCEYGGKRYWFRCPFFKSGAYCGRRVGVLYKNGDYFACRHCQHITYASRNLSGLYKGFVSMPDLDEQEARVKRTHYAGKPTKQYKKLLRMERRFTLSTATMLEKLENRMKI